MLNNLLAGDHFVLFLAQLLMPHRGMVRIMFSAPIFRARDTFTPGDLQRNRIYLTSKASPSGKRDAVSCRFRKPSDKVSERNLEFPSGGLR